MNNSTGIAANLIPTIIGTIVCVVLSIIVFELIGRYP
ncbi:Uncharacterised protein [Serratia quinivorans]|jgi:uncharacterized membrane protein|nr:Uncharacterised protein [Serratia quinivorans]CAI1534080.1 Uncharacterised protein [Serratia quinivorans]CAI1655181.1 Uncharacterised protein [Serratia quinivorans]